LSTTYGDGVKLTYEQECELLLRQYFGHAPVKDLAVEYGVPLNEVKKLIAEDQGARKREQRCLDETGSTVLLSPISRYLYTHLAKACPEYFTMEKLG